MNTNFEQEFKTQISKEQYELLIKDLELENNVYEQVNYYFDNENYDLKNNHIVLRIRQKKNSYKLTKKERGINENEALETHIFLNNETVVKDMIANGFNAEIIEINSYVKNICKLTTYRCKTSYKEGTIFLDKNEYYGHIDYEIEYEVDNIEQGYKDFIKFLDKYNITLIPTLRKSERAYNNIK